MARKSRKQIAVEEPVIESVSSEVFSTAIYARLSVENSGKSEKVDVIANQIEICKSYIAERPYLNLIDTYVDNGRTGTVFDRPEFNRLMNDIRTGRIKCLVVRDLSRFGRDYIEAGTYLDRVFPQIGLRFIAIKENYDNFDTDGSGESLIIPLQNMINTLYSKDISRKVSTALKAQMESGEFKKRNLPYGYRWDEEHSNKLEADVLAAIQLQVKAALNYDKLLAKLRNSEGERSIRDQQNALITSLNLKLSSISKKRTRLYEDFTEGILDEEEYAFAKKAYDEQYADLSRRLDEAVQRKVKFAEAMSEDNKWLTLMKSVSGATMLSQELVDESVELVKVHEDGSIELVMKYGDIYALTIQSIKEVQEAM